MNCTLIVNWCGISWCFWRIFDCSVGIPIWHRTYVECHIHARNDTFELQAYDSLGMRDLEYWLSKCKNVQIEQHIIGMRLWKQCITSTYQKQKVDCFDTNVAKVHRPHFFSCIISMCMYHLNMFPLFPTELYIILLGIILGTGCISEKNFKFVTPSS